MGWLRKVGGTAALAMMIIDVEARVF